MKPRPFKPKRGDTVRYKGKPARVIASIEKPQGTMKLRLMFVNGSTEDCSFSDGLRPEPAYKGDAAKLTSALAKL